MKRDPLMQISELPNAFKPNTSMTVKKRNFTAQMNAAMAMTDPADALKKEAEGEKVTYRYRSKEEKLEALDKIVGRGLEDLDSSQVMALFSAYRDLAAFDKMISLYKETDNEDFKNAPMVCEQLAVAYRKVPRGDNNTNENEKLADKMWDYHHSMDICLKLIDEGYGNGVTYENIGRCLRYIADKTEMNDKNAETKRKNELFTDSVARLEAGFMATLESSVGIQAVHGNIILGRNDKAKETAKVVYLAALRDGAEESNDYFCVSAALQAACIAGENEKVINHLYNRLENSIRYQWELDDITRDIEKISKAFPTEHVTMISKRLENLKKTAIPQEDHNGQKTDLIVFQHQLNTDRYLTEDPKLQALRDHSYSYRGCGSAFRGTNRVGGNMGFGGQLPDHTVSRKDLRLFTGLVKMSPAELGIKFDQNIQGADMEKLMSEPLTKIKDPELFMRVVDQFVRQTFSTENFADSGLHMEDNALKKNEFGESFYDATVKSVLRACGKTIGEKDNNIDTRTNISAIFALGMGDCRHHAQVKQIMFDMWQKQQMNECLSNMYYAAWQGKTVDTKGFQAQQFYDILDTELRTADVVVNVPVLMEQKQAEEWVNGKSVPKEDENKKPVMEDKPYSPLLTEDGKFVVDETNAPHSLEEHTLCWLIKKDRDGNLTGFGMRDAFYQKALYEWGHRDVSLEDIQVENGKPKIPAGKIPGSKTSTGKDINVFQTPTGYNSGKRDTVVSNSIGRDVCLVGVPLAGFDNPKTFLKKIKNRYRMFQIMEDTLLNDPATKGKEQWKKEILNRKRQKKFPLHQGMCQQAQKISASDEQNKGHSLQGNLTQISNVAKVKKQKLKGRGNEGNGL